MRKFVVTLILGAITAGNLSAAYNPYVDGAKADVRVRVVDDRGEPVQNALVSIIFLTDVQKVEVARGTSDAEGRFGAVRNCIGELRLWVRKDGYYETHTTKTLWELQSREMTLKSHRWQEKPIELSAVLKKKHNPVNMAFHSVDFRPYPATNEVFKLDLETLEWCPPFGSGKHDDMHLVFDGWRNPLDWDDFHEHLKVSFPNCVDGFYEQKVDSSSSFKYAYRADENGTYVKKLELRNVHTKDGITESKKLPADSYLIYRVRTETNELGQVIHAHYGRIGEKFSQNIGLSIKSWFNTTDNDTNLEDARMR